MREGETDDKDKEVEKEREWIKDRKKENSDCNFS